MTLWFMLGLTGYIAMFCYRIIFDGLPKNVPWYSYLIGLSSMLLGPFIFVLIALVLWCENE